MQFSIHLLILLLEDFIIKNYAEKKCTLPNFPNGKTETLKRDKKTSGKFVIKWKIKVQSFVLFCVEEPKRQIWIFNFSFERNLARKWKFYFFIPMFSNLSNGIQLFDCTFLVFSNFLWFMNEKLCHFLFTSTISLITSYCNIRALPAHLHGYNKHLALCCSSRYNQIH